MQHKSGYAILKARYAALQEKYDVLLTQLGDLQTTHNITLADLAIAQGNNPVKSLINTRQRIVPTIGMKLGGFKPLTIGQVTTGELKVGDKVQQVKVKLTKEGYNVLDAITMKSIQMFGVNDDHTLTAVATEEVAAKLLEASRLRVAQV